MTLRICQPRFAVRFPVPHPIPYQGSKRRLALAILSHVEDDRYKRLVEPFAGSAAVTLAAAKYGKVSSFLIGDRLEPLVELWQRIIEGPAAVADEYETLWNRERERPIDEYYAIRAEFNKDRDPAKLLYLLARCVKNAVRFNPSGEFNQSPDKRRKGTHPEAMRKELGAAHRLLAGRSATVCGDFTDVFNSAKPGDFFYLDPPYQGTSEGKDSRYIGGVSRERMVEGLEILNAKGVPFVLSYDGSCGERTYGDRLPSELASRILLDVGRSSQATLNGEEHVTIESLYISHDIAPACADDGMVTLRDFDEQRSIPLV
jgi:DNA adenine methylase